jgi:hypothetical protein
LVCAISNSLAFNSGSQPRKGREPEHLAGWAGRPGWRLAPEGVPYVSSWVDEGLERFYQVMQTHDCKLLEEWIAKWTDIVRF